jgi:hypothetical protein
LIAIAGSLVPKYRKTQHYSQFGPPSRACIYGHAIQLGAVLGQARAGEQTLLKRLVKRRPELFAGSVTCFDRNFPGHELITAILDAGGHVIAQVLDHEAAPAARVRDTYLTRRSAPETTFGDGLVANCAPIPSTTA